MIRICYVVGYNSENNSKILKVQYESRVIFAKILYPYLGTTYKHIWQPKIGTKALVFLENNTADEGIILGFLEKTGDEPLLSFSDEGDKELFQHENGVKIEFINKENERKMTITTPKEEQIDIDIDKRSFEVKSKDEKTHILFNFEESKIELKSEELNIEIAKNITVKSGGTIDINASENIDISASSSMNIKGQSINLN